MAFKIKYDAESLLRPMSMNSTDNTSCTSGLMSLYQFFYNELKHEKSYR